MVVWPPLSILYVTLERKDDSERIIDRDDVSLIEEALPLQSVCYRGRLPHVAKIIKKPPSEIFCPSRFMSRYSTGLSLRRCLGETVPKELDSLLSREAEISRYGENFEKDLHSRSMAMQALIKGETGIDRLRAWVFTASHLTYKGQWTGGCGTDGQGCRS